MWFIFALVLIISSPLVHSKSTPSSSNDVITGICSTNMDQPYCQNTLRTFPGLHPNPTLDAIGLAAIDIATNATVLATASVLALFEGEKDMNLKRLLLACWENYDEAISSIKLCGSAFKGKDYLKFLDLSLHSLAMERLCDEFFIRQKIDEPAQLLRIAHQTEPLVNIAVSVAKKFDSTTVPDDRSGVFYKITGILFSSLFLLI